MKVALIGSQPHSTHLAPHEDAKWQAFREGLPPGFPGGFSLPERWVEDDWEIWACSPGAAASLRRCTRFFELHRWEPGKPWFAPAYVEFLKGFRGPVYTGGPVAEIPNHQVYPLERVEAEFSSYFLTSSLALMCALAILEIEDARKARANGDGDDVIGFWGVDMAAAEEYGYQRAGCQHFILEALRRGIGIYVPPESCLLRPMPVYGISEWGHSYIKLTQRAREFNAAIQEANAEREKINLKIAALAGSLEDLNYMVSTWTSPYGLPPGTIIRMKGDAPPKRETAGDGSPHYPMHAVAEEARPAPRGHGQY